MTVDAVIPARDAAATLPGVLARLPMRQLRSVVVVDHGSRDATGALARDAGALVLREPRGGYGAACLTAIAHLATLPEPPAAVVFLPADGRADGADLPALLEPLADGSAELAIGVRAGAKPIGERVVVGLIRAVYRHQFHDTGPMRAVRFPALVALGMSDRGSGWDVEMQVRALKLGLAIAEVPVGAGIPVPTASLRERIGPHAAASAASAGGRSLFHILRHATMR